MTDMDQGKYEEHLERMRERQRRISQQGRDIAPLPEIVDIERRIAAGKSFKIFCETYFPKVFYLPWADDHIKVIERIEKAVRRGEFFPLAMPRGSGKTSLCERAVLWSTLYGYRSFVVLVSKTAGDAKDSLEALQAELDMNDLLYEDFPEVIHPIRSLEGNSQKCDGQRYNGQRTHIGWSKETIRYACLKPQEDYWQDPRCRELLDDEGWSATTGVRFKAVGLTAGIRGMKDQTVKGDSPRPDMVVVDDPQTTKSADSAKRTQTRVGIIKSAILELAGPDKKLAGVMPCTVIQQGDLSDQLLDRERNPEFGGERMKAMYSMPDNMELWDKYAEIAEQSWRSGGDMKPATEFYREHRQEMDKGAIVAWPQRKKDDEISGIQSCMNVRLFRPEVFAAEYQNEPLEENEDDALPTEDEIMDKVNGRKRCTVPESCETLTAYIDVHQNLLFYVVTAWETDFTGYVVDYGTTPQQNRRLFQMRKVTDKLETAYPETDINGAVYAGLEALAADILGHTWKREDGAEIRIDRCLVDQGWKTDLVHQWIKQTRHSNILPARGYGVRASNKPWDEYTWKTGQKPGIHWFITAPKPGRSLRHVEIDTNWWKTFLMERINTAMGDRGCLSIFGNNPVSHRLYAQHLTSETRHRTEGRGREVDEWQLPTAGRDNHWFDCTVGCCVAASMEGVSCMGAQHEQQKKERRKLSEIYAEKHGNKRSRGRTRSF